MANVYEFFVRTIEEAQTALDALADEDYPTDIEMMPNGFVAVRFWPNCSPKALYEWIDKSGIELLVDEDVSKFIVTI